MRIDERDDQEERLLRRGIRVEELQSAFVTVGVVRRLAAHKARVILRSAATHLGEALVGAGIVRVPAIEGVGVEVGRRPFGTGRLAAVPLALVDHGVAGGRHHRCDVREAGRERYLIGVLRIGHVRLERVLDAVLCGEVAGHQRRASWRAHAGVRKGVGECQSVALELRHARHVLLCPTDWKVLDGTLLVGDEHDDVHPLEVGRSGLLGRVSHARQAQ